jgi:hypothetical protein
MFTATPTRDLSTIRRAVDRTSYTNGRFNTVPFMQTCSLRNRRC